MGFVCSKANENIYFKARKNASKYNEKLFSREGASELLGVSVSTLADYELGVTKIVPVDKVVLMSELYNAPELKAGYCKNECPIGKNLPVATKINSLEGIVLRIIKEFEMAGKVQNRLIKIASDGEIGTDEKETLKEIIRKLDEISLVISEMKLFGEKALRGMK